jgi:hypothetical protein
MRVLAGPKANLSPPDEIATRATGRFSLLLYRAVEFH